MSEHQNRRRPPIDRMLRDTLAVVMAGGRGERLGPLTAAQAKPAIPFGGKYRIIDFTLSNCVNSGINKICILTQYRAHSLIRHIELGWSFSRHEFDEFIELLPAQERAAASPFFYQGTADAVYQNLDIILDHAPSYVLVLAGDHIYKMDYGLMLAMHVEQQADITVGCVQVPLREAPGFGIMTVDEHYRVIGFQEKPEAAEPMPGEPGAALASMGIYLFSTALLREILERDAVDDRSAHDFGRNIIPGYYRDRRVIACPFDDVGGGGHYWRDVGTVDAYYQANLELIGVTPPLNLYDRDWPIRTAPSQLPPAKFVFDSDKRRGIAVDSMISSGCIISGATVRHSLLSDNVRVNSYSTVEDSVILPDVEIGRHCRIKHAIIDSNCRIPAETVIGENPAEDRRRFFVSPYGVTLVSADMLREGGRAGGSPPRLAAVRSRRR